MIRELSDYEDEMGMKEWDYITVIQTKWTTIEPIIGKESSRLGEALLVYNNNGN